MRCLMILEKSQAKLGVAMNLHGIAEASGIVFQWVALYLSGRAMNLFKMSMFNITRHWDNPSVVLSRAIFLHFLFGILDGTYWQSAWTAKYIAHPYEQWLFENGIIANIPFRHVGPSIVAYMHLYARAIQEGVGMAKYHKEIVLAAIFGLLHVVWITPN